MPAVITLIARQHSGVFPATCPTQYDKRPPLIYIVMRILERPLMTYSFFTRRSSFTVLSAILSLAVIPALYAQSSAGPQPAPLPPPIVAPADTPYPGTISLLVDATNVNDRIFNVHETIPVKAGKL